MIAVITVRINGETLAQITSPQLYDKSASRDGGSSGAATVRGRPAPEDAPLTIKEGGAPSAAAR